MKHQGILAVCLVLSIQGLCAGDTVDTVRGSGIRGGIIVHLGCGDGQDTTAMLLGSSYMVHGLDTDGENVAKARAHIQSKNLFDRVAICNLNK